MTRQKPKHYDLEFKKDVVRLSYEGSKSVVEICSDMGVSTKNLYRWRKELLEQGVIKIDKEVLEQGEELKKLRRENAELKLEREILKKAMVIFTANKR